jgi:hypothetical protein
VPTPGDYDDEEIGEMIIGRGNRILIIQNSLNEMF